MIAYFIAPRNQGRVKVRKGFRYSISYDRGVWHGSLASIPHAALAPAVAIFVQMKTNIGYWPGPGVYRDPELFQERDVLAICITDPRLPIMWFMNAWSPWDMVGVMEESRVAHDLVLPEATWNGVPPLFEPRLDHPPAGYTRA